MRYVLDPDAKRRDALYRQAGEALHLSQSLETFVAVLIALVNQRFDDDVDIDGLVLPDNRDTLGRLLVRVRSAVDVDANGEEMLNEALRARNNVAHRFFNEHVRAFGDPEAHDEALEFLRSETKSIAIGAALTSGWCSALCEAWDIDSGSILVRQRLMTPHRSIRD